MEDQDHDSDLAHHNHSPKPEMTRSFLGSPMGEFVPNPVFRPMHDIRLALGDSTQSASAAYIGSYWRALLHGDTSAHREAPQPERAFGNMRHLPPPHPRLPPPPSLSSYNPNGPPPATYRSIFDPLPWNPQLFHASPNFEGTPLLATQPRSQAVFPPLRSSEVFAQPDSPIPLRTSDSWEPIDQRPPYSSSGNRGERAASPPPLARLRQPNDSFQDFPTTHSAGQSSHYDSLSDSLNVTHLDSLLTATHLVRRPENSDVDTNGTDSRPRTPRPHTPRRRHRSRPPRAMPCSACLEDIPNENLLTLECQCQYCYECLNGAFRAGCSTMGSFPPRCCGNPLRIMVWGYLLKPDVLERYKTIEAEFSSHRPLYCAKKTCSEFIPDTAYLLTEEAGHCSKCQTITCKLCLKAEKAHRHWQLRRRICPEEDADETALLTLSAQRNWRQCPTCNVMVEKTNGCNHVECVCGVDFCYVCGELFDEEGLCDCRGSWVGDETAEGGHHDEEEEEWPDFRAAVDLLGRPTCLHWNTEALELETAEACHGCLRFSDELKGCNDCQLELCEMCLSNIHGLARINGEVGQADAGNAPTPGLPHVHQGQRA